MKYIILALIFALSAPAVFAQAKIDKVINDIENRKDVTGTYTERRTVKGKKLYRTTKVLSFTNSQYYDRLAKAFEDERSNSVSATLSNGTRHYRFISNKTDCSYTLSEDNGVYCVVMSWRDTSIDEDDGSYMADPVGPTFYGELSREEIARLQEWGRQAREQAEQIRLEAEQRKQLVSMRRQATKERREQAVKQRQLAAKERKEAAKERREQAVKQRQLAAKERQEAKERRKMASERQKAARNAYTI